MPEFLQNFDVWLFHILNSGIANPVFDKIFPFITDLKNWALVYIFFFGFLLWKGGPRGRICVLVLILAVSFTNEINSHLLKDLFERLRPCRSIENVRLLVNCGPGKSFPSSHAANNFAMAMILAFFYRKYLWFFFTIAAMMAFSRVYIGVHYPLDILGGSIVGTLTGMISIIMLAKPLAKKFVHNPAAPG